MQKFYVKIFYPLILLGFASLTVVGCDSSDPDDDMTDTDAMRFVGAWTVISASDQNGDQTATLAALGTISIDLKDDGTYALTIQPPQGNPTLLEGNYTVDESGKQLSLMVMTSQGELNLPLPYTFNSDTEAELTMSSIVLGQLLGDLMGIQGNIQMTISKTN